MACGGSSGKNKQAQTPAHKACPSFQSDSAFRYIEEQCNFGPRLLGTPEADKCAEWIKSQFERMGCAVAEQKAQVSTWDGTKMPCRNIIASYNTSATSRIMLCAHWDTRPWADNDPNPDNHKTPVLGANDGASGVGVLLEVARQLQAQPTAIGIDIIFFDAEDYGTPAWHRGTYKPHDWCLGSQYWGRTPHVQGYYARYGILLDMVGGKGGTFYYEPYSYRTARKEVKKIWEKAHELGYGSYFVKQEGSEVTDDHVYVNQLARIPCVDIINYDPVYENSSFGPTWHTVNDNISNIDRNTLKAVGQTVMDVIYNEK